MNFLLKVVDLDQMLQDGGLRYAETDLNFVIAEPWNGISSLAFLIPVIYWLFKIRKDKDKHYFLIYCMPLLAIGGLGSALFHGFRVSPLFLLMDYLPITILTISVSCYFWLKLLPKWWQAALIFVPYIFFRFVMLYMAETHQTLNFAYAVTGTMIFLPAVFLLFQTKFLKVKHLVISILCFILALWFRELDGFSADYLPMGSHFLWHIFGAIGSYFLASYLFYLQKYTVSKELVKKEETIFQTIVSPDFKIN